MVLKSPPPEKEGIKMTNRRPHSHSWCLLGICGAVLISLTAGLQAAIAQDRGNVSAHEYGDAVYRTLQGYWGYDYNHTAIFSGLDTVHEGKVRQALGAGYTTQEAYLASSDETMGRFRLRKSA